MEMYTLFDKVKSRRNRIGFGVLLSALSLYTAQLAGGV